MLNNYSTTSAIDKMTVTANGKVSSCLASFQASLHQLYQLTMRIGQGGNQAFVLHPGGSFAFEERSIPTIQSDRDIIVRVAVTGLCGSDVSHRPFLLAALVY